MITRLDPSQYRRTPWKNGGGVTVDIAGQDEVWHFGRTPITAPGPFSDYAGFDRLQVLVAGQGLVLDTPGGEIDVRTPFEPVRFGGETPIVSRLEAGPVEVVNLIGARTKVRIALEVLKTDSALAVEAGTHLAYAAHGAGALEVNGTSCRLAADHAVRIDATVPTMIKGTGGVLLLGSIICV